MTVTLYCWSDLNIAMVGVWSEFESEYAFKASSLLERKTNQKKSGGQITVHFATKLCLFTAEEIRRPKYNLFHGETMLVHGRRNPETKVPFIRSKTLLVYGRGNPETKTQFISLRNFACP